MQGTHCPFCRTELNPGATVCHACGAIYDTPEMSGGAALGWLIILFWLVGGLVFAYDSIKKFDVMGVLMGLGIFAIACFFVWVGSFGFRPRWLKYK